MKKHLIIGNKKKQVPEPVSVAVLKQGEAFWILNTKTREIYPITLSFVFDSMGIISCSFPKKPYQMICMAKDKKEAETKFINQLKNKKKDVRIISNP